MKIVPNNIIPFKGFLAINLFGILFVRQDSWARKTEAQKAVTINHELIHTEQMKETLYIGFYLLYLLMWLVRLLTPPWDTAYQDISFEQEAYCNEKNLNYLKTRKPYNWLNYCFTSYRNSLNK